ncbi:MAG: AbrB/MazE/SpoVT family DNA-binding domain-containing protein [Candidatus Kariarchaeaceae archaeon]|jgi:AbrB family looped-hinge helix DNA binding protein
MELNKITMATATLTKNGMINLPVEIRKKFNLKPGDKISFVDTGEGIMVVPIKNLFELIDPDQKEITIEMVKELIKEHKEDAAKGR